MCRVLKRTVSIRVIWVITIWFTGLWYPCRTKRLVRNSLLHLKSLNDFLSSHSFNYSMRLLFQQPVEPYSPPYSLHAQLMRIKDKPIAIKSEPIAIPNESLVSKIIINFSVDVIKYYTLYCSHSPSCAVIAVRSMNRPWLSRLGRIWTHDKGIMSPLL